MKLQHRCTALFPSLPSSSSADVSPSVSLPQKRGGWGYGAWFMPLPAESRGMKAAVTQHSKAVALWQSALGDAPAVSASAWGASPYLRGAQDGLLG